MVGEIILMVYVALSSTLGAWWLASNSLQAKGKKISLMDILGNVLPAVMFSWLFVPMLLLDKVKVRKLK